MVHVGVSGIANEVQLEKQAFNCGYKSPDVKECFPEDNRCVPGAGNCIQSGIDMATTCHDINSSCGGVMSCVSDDPGRYLCDFIYFTSLNIDPKRTAFIHVPVINKPYTAQQLARALYVAIKSMLQQVQESCSETVAAQ